MTRRLSLRLPLRDKPDKAAWDSFGPPAMVGAGISFPLMAIAFAVSTVAASFIMGAAQ